MATLTQSLQHILNEQDPLLAADGSVPYGASTAMLTLAERVAGIRTADLAVGLLPMFESRAFIKAWIEHFHENFGRYLVGYLA